LTLRSSHPLKTKTPCTMAQSSKSQL